MKEGPGHPVIFLAKLINQGGLSNAGSAGDKKNHFLPAVIHGVRPKVESPNLVFASLRIVENESPRKVDVSCGHIFWKRKFVTVSLYSLFSNVRWARKWQEIFCYSKTLVVLTEFRGSLEENDLRYKASLKIYFRIMAK